MKLNTTTDEEVPIKNREEEVMAYKDQVNYED